MRPVTSFLLLALFNRLAECHIFSELWNLPGACYLVCWVNTGSLYTWPLPSHDVMSHKQCVCFNRVRLQGVILAEKIGQEGWASWWGRVWVMGRGQMSWGHTHLSYPLGFITQPTAYHPRALNAPVGVPESIVQGRLQERAPRSLNRAHTDNCHPNSKISKSAHTPGAVFILFSPIYF